MTILILKFICLLLAVLYGYSNTVKAIYGQNVSSAQMLFMGLGVAGFIFLQWCL